MVTVRYGNMSAGRTSGIARRPPTF
jgi:hypothetical protein